MANDYAKALEWLNGSKVAFLREDGHVRSTIDGDIYHYLETIRTTLEMAQRVEGLFSALNMYMLKVDMHEGKVLSAPMPTHSDIRRWKDALAALRQEGE